MDLSFTRFEQDVSATILPPDLAVMLVGIAARQATSPTALINARTIIPDYEASLLAPAHGSFSLATAQMLAACKQE